MRICFFILSLCLLVPSLVRAGDAPKGEDANGNLSLTEVLNLPSTLATLTGTSTSKVPTSITTISSQDIERTPARNMYDLIEAYVPGALYMIHSEGYHPGFRGIIADRDYKFLLIVNGRVMNQKAHNGAVSELLNWDLNDIERIEIIRGPGSVTYGAGAVMGVINITTKDAETAPGTRVGLSYVAPYQAKGAFVSEGKKFNENLELFAYASVTGSKGAKPDIFAADTSGNVGYVGRDFVAGSLYANPVMSYLDDYRGAPQYKLYAEAKIHKEWNVWARYTTVGGSLTYAGQSAGAETGYRGGTIDFKQFGDRQATVTLENHHVFSPQFELKSMMSWESQDYRRQFDNVVFADNLDDARNFRSDFSETEYFIRSLGIFKFGSINKTALGFELARNFWGPGWGQDSTHFRMGDNTEIVGDGSPVPDPTVPTTVNESGSLNPSRVINAGQGWATNTYSLMGETQFDFSRYFTLFASIRSDKNTFSKNLVSPRIAAVSQVGDNSYLKLIWQQSRRMNTAEQLYVQDRAGGRADPEKLSGVELIYTTLPMDKVLITASGFYDQVQVLAWDRSKAATALKGDLDLYGFEAEAKYSTKALTVGLNHAFTKQLSWKLADGQNSSGISYADYHQSTSSGVVIHGSGNNLNNLANNATKVFAAYQLNDKWSVFANSILYWGLEGAQDGLDALERSVAGTPSQAVADAAVAKIRDKNTYKAFFTLNASTKYMLLEALSLNLYMMNILGTDRRYSYDGGLNRDVPHRTAFIEEPRTVGVQLKYTL